MDTAKDTPAEQHRMEKEDIEDLGTVTLSRGGHVIHCLTVIGQIEGHTEAPQGQKTTKYEHVIPQLVACRSAWIIFPGAFAAKQSSRTRLAFSLVIRWKMSLALWQTRAKIIRSAVTGNAMATPLQHKRRLNASANALKFISAVSRAVHRSPGSQ